MAGVDGLGRTGSTEDTSRPKRYGTLGGDKSNTDIAMDQFFSLIAAQLSNQDMMNPVSDSEFMSQLVQISTIQAMEHMTNMSQTNYAASLVGKKVTTAYIGADKELVQTTGVVTGAGFYDGSPCIFIDGKSFDIGEVMIVGEQGKAEAPDDGEDSGDSGDNSEGGESGGEGNESTTV